MRFPHLVCVENAKISNFGKQNMSGLHQLLCHYLFRKLKILCSVRLIIFQFYTIYLCGIFLLFFPLFRFSQNFSVFFRFSQKISVGRHKKLAVSGPWQNPFSDIKGFGPEAANSILLLSEQFEPIGISNYYYFQGTFDGQGT